MMNLRKQNMHGVPVDTTQLAFQLTRLSVIVCGLCAISQAEDKTSSPLPQLYPVLRDGSWGYIDSNGELLVKPQFSTAKDFIGGYAGVSKGHKLGYIQSDGSWAIELPPLADSLRPVSEGRVWFRQSDLWGCVNEASEIIVNPTYDSVENFSEGFAVVRKFQKHSSSDKYGMPSITENAGYVDRTGQIVIPLCYRKASSFSEGLAGVRGHNSSPEHMYIDKTGKTVIALDKFIKAPLEEIHRYAAFSEGVATIYVSRNNGLDAYGLLIDKKGKPIECVCYGMRSFSEGLSIFHVEKYGYRSLDGCVIIPPIYDDGGDFHESVCRVRRGEEWYYVNKHGAITLRCDDVNCRWNDAEDFRGELARVHVGGEFQIALDGPAWWAGGQWQYIDKRGRVVAICRIDGEKPSDHPFGKESYGAGQP